jgi:hypothetical protein
MHFGDVPRLGIWSQSLMVKVQPSCHRHASTRQGSKMPHQECTLLLVLVTKVDTDSRPDSPNGPMSSGIVNLKKQVVNLLG